MNYDKADGYTELINAIMGQAADDYRAAMSLYVKSAEIVASLKRQAELPSAPAIIGERIKEAENRQNGAAAEMEKIERFFRSKWASVLTGGANMGYIIRELRKEYGINDIQRH